MNGVLIDAKNINGEVIVPDNITIIPYDIFAYNKNLTSIIIPDTVKSIEIGAFKCCTKVTVTNKVVN